MSLHVCQWTQTDAGRSQSPKLKLLSASLKGERQMEMNWNAVLVRKGRLLEVQNNFGLSVVIKHCTKTAGSGSGSGGGAHLKNEICLVSFFTFDTLFFLLCSLSFFHVFVFATSKVDGGANHVNVKHSWNYCRSENISFHIFIEIAFI